jgi:hypothetical protein
MPHDEPPLWKSVAAVALFFGIPVAVGLAIAIVAEIAGVSEYWAGILGTTVALAGLYCFLLTVEVLPSDAKLVAARAGHNIQSSSASILPTAVWLRLAILPHWRRGFKMALSAKNARHMKVDCTA